MMVRGGAGRHRIRCSGDLTPNMISRRAFITRAALGIGAIATEFSHQLSANAELARLVNDDSTGSSVRPLTPITTWHTDAKRRFTPAQSIAWEPVSKPASSQTIQLVLANKFQEILGFGGCLSDASCYLISQLAEPAREQLLHELFHPSQMGLSVNRTCIGSADSARTLYSYDEGEADPELKRFSIDHDRAYILPVLRRVRAINPDVYYFSAPWSPPGWMKWNKSMLGGSMSRQYLSSYAQYLLKFVQAYADEGVPIQAITAQNEIDTDQHGQMPACMWSQECETEFIIEHLGPLFEKTNTPVEIWILDHNYVYWGRVISELDDRDFRRYARSVAWHGYAGEPTMMSKVHAAHPEVEMHFTEGSTDYNDPHYQDDWSKWASTYTAVLNNWCRSAMAWNVATDEHGKPNIGPYPTGGIVMINSRSGEITRSGQYWALAHFSRTLSRGARRFESQSQAADIGHIAFENPGGEKVLILTNAGPTQTIDVRMGLTSASVSVEANSVASLVWR